MRREVKGLRKRTVLQTTSLIERRTTLLKRIQRFRDIQQVYMPELDPQQVARVLRSASANAPSTVHVEDAIRPPRCATPSILCSRACSCRGSPAICRGLRVTRSPSTPPSHSHIRQQIQDQECYRSEKQYTITRNTESY
jgi:hypothetical protein